MNTYTHTEANLSVNIINSLPMTATVYASLFALSNPISLYSAVLTLAAKELGSGQTSPLSMQDIVGESGGTACIAVWLGEQYQPLLVSDTVHRSKY